MWQAILAFLKKAAAKAGTAALQAGKTAAAHPYKTILGGTAAGSLYNAFSGAGQEQGNKGATPEQSTAPSRPMASDMGITGFIGNNQPGQAGQTIQPQQKPIIPASVQPFVRTGGMQNQQSQVPPEYLAMANAGKQTQNRPDVGFIRGAINASTGQPQPEGLGDVSQGRRTAYYGGTLIPRIVMSRLGVPSPEESTAQQQLIEQRSNMSNGQMVVDPQTGQVLYNRPKGSVFQPVTESPVYMTDPMTGETKQTATVPKGAKVISQAQPTTERIQMGSALDSMSSSIDAMEIKLKDPNILLRNVNPFGEREFKAVLSSFDKEAAIAAGGKQLTNTELKLIRDTRPTVLDFKTPGAIEYKINKLRSVVKNAKSRLGTAGGISNVAQQNEDPLGLR